MTVHVLHAGNGYTYLTRQVASGDDYRARGQSLADYYTAHGNPPGVWLGSGLGQLDVEGEVSEEQMRALLGRGMHPDAERLLPGGTRDCTRSEHRYGERLGNGAKSSRTMIW